MDKNKILCVILVIMLSSILAVDSSSLGDEANLNYSSNGENLILNSQSFIDVIQQNGNIGSYESFEIVETVADSAGSTYLALLVT